MSSGSRGGRGNEKSSKTVSDQNSHNNAITEKNLKSVPTADQIRLAQITENSQDHALQEKIEQFMAITNKSREDASIILHDCGNDLQAAVEATFEGNTNLDTWHERTKKKKTKSKGELENKENRRGGGGHAANDNNRERSASRGRGGGAAGGRGGAGRGRKEGDSGRGTTSSRRGGRMANGGGPVGGGGSRGRGGRSIRGGRGGGSAGASHFSDNTFHSNRQNLPPYEEIDTWGETKMEGLDEIVSSDPCPIEEWNDEWTGSLEKTSVFVHSSVEPTPPPASDLTATDAAKLVNSSPLLQSSYQEDGLGGTGGSSGGAGVQSYSAAANQVPGLPAGSQQKTQSGQQQSTGMSSSSIALAALLQKAAPQSLLSTVSSTTTNGNVGHLQQQQSVQQQHIASSILGGISTNMGDVIKASSNAGAVNSSGGVAGVPQQQQSLGSNAGTNAVPYSVNAGVSLSSNYNVSQHNSIFSTSLQNTVSRSLGSSLSSSNSSGINSSSSSTSVGGNVGVNKWATSSTSNKPGVILPSHQGVTLPPSQGQPHRPKQNKVKPQQTSKIPLSAVEMPEDVMSAINMRMTGLQFGAESFDFLSDSNKPSSGLSNDTQPAQQQPYNSATNAAAYSAPPPAGYGQSTNVSAASVSTPSYGVSVNSMPVSSPPGVASSYVNSSYHGGSSYPSAASSSVSSYQSQSTYSSNSISNAVTGLAQDRSDVQKSLSSVKQSSLAQASKLGPEPIPYPPSKQQSSSNSATASSAAGASPSDLKSQQLSNSSNSAPDNSSSSTAANNSSSNSSYMSMRPDAAVAAAVVAASTTPQKKDLGGGASSASLSGPALSANTAGLGGLVGSAGVPSNTSHYSSYSLPPKTSTNFPSPPTGPYTQTPVQNYSSNAVDSSNSSGYGSTNSGSSSNANSGSNSSTGGSGTANSSNYGGSSSSYGVSSSAAGGQYSGSSVSSSSVQQPQYQASYSSSSHTGLGINSSKQLTPLKEPNQVNYSGNDTSVSAGANANNAVSNSGVANSTSVASTLSSLQHAAAVHHQPQKTVTSSIPPQGNTSNKSMSGVGMQTVVQQHHSQQPTHMTQHQVAAVAQQQVVVQQPQQPQQHQFVNSNALQNTVPYFPGLQQPTIYSYEELQLLQQRIPHMPQQAVPSTLPGSRDANSLSAGAYSAADMSKFRTDQNSSPVPSAINTQGAHAGPYAASAAAAMHPMYMYHQNVVPSTAFPQYATQAIIQLPPNTAGSNTSQFQPGAPKMQYNAAAAAPTYYDSQSGGDYKTAYGSASQAQNKPGVGNNTASMANSVSEMPTYKNHLTKSYDKSAFHTSTPPPFNLAGSAGTPYGHAQVFLPTMPQHHQSTLMHHQLHQDGSGSGAQRGSSSAVQNKNTSKASYQQTTFWSN